jgi:tetratricopeptide (TPR) repeat protein
LARIRSPNRGWFGLLGMLIVLGPTSTALARKPIDPVQAHATRLANLQKAVTQLTREYKNPVALTRKFPMQRRLIDARVFFELKNYEPSAILLHELIERPAFKTSPDYWGALMLLGRCMAKLDNRRGAERYLQRALAAPDSRVASEARFHLIELLLTTRRIGTLRRMVANMAIPKAINTRYALGKAKLRIKEYQQGLDLLNSIPASSTYGLFARYYIGVAYTGKKQYKKALAIFRNLSTLQGKTDKVKKVRILALLATGRLHYELGQLNKAITAYQRVPRASDLYERALYETAWANIKRERYDKALEAVDVLLILVKDPQLSVDAHVLRGRLATQLADYDEAVASYHRIINQFAPIRNEMNQFAKKPNNVQRYFTWLIERYAHRAGSLNAPLSKRTATWLQSTSAMRRVVRVLGNLGKERKDALEARRIASDLIRVVTAANRVELFPHLKEGWTRALVLQNKLLNLTSSTLDHQYARLGSRLKGAVKNGLARLVTRRRAIEKRFRQLPTTYEEYEDRQARVDSRYVDIKRKGFLVAQRLKLIKRQLMAIEEHLNRKQFANRGKKLDTKREKAVRDEISREKKRIQALYRDMQKLQDEIKAGSVKVGVGDAITKKERNLKQLLIAAQKREGLRYDQLTNKVGTRESMSFIYLGKLRVSIFGEVEKLTGLIRTIDQRVTAKAASMKALIVAEQRHLDDYGREMKSYEMDSRNITQSIGWKIFKKAHRQMRTVVLGADKGLIDVAWHRKDQQMKKIARIAADKDKKLTELQNEKDRLLREAGPAKGEP